MKQRFVTPTFDIIAPRYDRLTRIFSFGMDRGWKRELLAAATRAGAAQAGEVALARGRGGLLLVGPRRLRAASVAGLDASAPMRQLAETGRGEAGADRVRLADGDTSRLVSPVAYMRVVTAG